MGMHPIEYRARWPDIARLKLKPGDVVLDVGANVGSFVECCLAYQPWVIIHAFEPLPDCYQTLHSKFLSFARVFIENKAVGCKESELSINVSQFSEASSFLKQTKVLEDGLYGIDFSIKQKLTVPVIKLSDYIKENSLETIRLLKIDTQGFELEVLKGANESLNNMEFIYLEGAFKPLYENQSLVNDLQMYLSQYGFSLENMCSIRLDDNCDLLECDMLFWNRQYAGN